MTIGINFNEGGKPTLDYKSVGMSYSVDGKRQKKKFDLGNFVKDWYDAIKWIIQSEIEEPLCNSSSVDHFIMDGAPYDSAYLIATEKDAYLTYEYYETLEFFVPKGTKPTWKELKKMCDDSN